MSRKRRKPLLKKMNPTFYVFCEGETEQEYINFLRSNFRVPIEIKSRVSGTKITSRYIRSYLRGRPFYLDKDKVFLMYDLDVEGVVDRLKSITDAELLVSNPCIEVWFLFHGYNQTRSLSTKECIEETIKKWGGYQKGIFTSRLKEELFENYKLAVHHARQKETFSNPSSTVYRLLEIIEKVKSGR